MSDSTPGGLREILDAYRDFWIAPKADRILNTDQAIAAIEALVPEKLNKGDSWSNMYDTVIDTIHRNFKGEHDD